MASLIGLLLLFFLSLHLIQTSPHLGALLGTAMRACGMTRETRGTGVEVLLEKEATGVVQVDQILGPHPGVGLHHLTSSPPGGTSLISLLGASGSPHFLHACRHVLDKGLLSVFSVKIL